RDRPSPGTVALRPVGGACRQPGQSGPLRNLRHTVVYAGRCQPVVHAECVLIDADHLVRHPQEPDERRHPPVDVGTERCGAAAGPQSDRRRTHQLLKPFRYRQSPFFGYTNEPAIVRVTVAGCFLAYRFVLPLRNFRHPRRAGMAIRDVSLSTRCIAGNGRPLQIRTDVGIFSLFGKKDGQPARKPAESDATRKRRDGNTARPKVDEQTQQVQRKAAQATALKIDAIESEMSSEFVKPLPFSGNTMPGPPSQFLNTNIPRPETAEAQTKPQSDPASKVAAKTADKTAAKADTSAESDNPSVLPDIMGASTAFLLGAETVIGRPAISASEAAPVIEEAAILFANGQTDMIEPIL